MRHGRWGTAIHIATVSSPALTNSATAIVSLMVMPLFEVLLLVAIRASVGESDLLETAYAGIVVAFGLTVLTGVVEHVTRDRRYGVLYEVLSLGPLAPTYWIGKLIVPILLGIPAAALGALAVFGLDPGHNVGRLTRVLLLIPSAAIVGAAVGLSAALISIRFSDPYLVSNVARDVLLITSGVVLPITLYPTVLARIAAVLPFTATVEAVRSDGGARIYVLRDFGVAAAYSGLGLLMSRRVMKSVRSGRREDIW